MVQVHEPIPKPPQRSPADRPGGARERSLRWMPWVVLVVGTMLLFDVVSLVWVGVIAPTAAVVLAVLQRDRPPEGVRWFRSEVDRRDVVAVAVFYLVVVGLFRLAFEGFGTDRVAGLFLSFAAGLLIGVAGPVIYMVWHRGRSLRDLGIGGHHLRPAIALGLLLAGIQFAMTLWGYDLPEPVDWAPLLVMSLVVGAFEAVFFRGFIQGRLEASFGTATAVIVAATLYSLYHVGYGMGSSEMGFLFGLGVLYAIAYRLVENVLVLWPLLTPLGAFFNNLEAGDIELPWASIAGFADVAIVMVVVIALAHRHERKRTPTADEHSTGEPPQPAAAAPIARGVDGDV
jgi:membrane protease YdiL (CAAX protease family)